jgi:hypothetical protein
MSVISLVSSADDDEFLSQVYNLMAYLLKNNFDTLQMDLEPAEEVVYCTQGVLMRDKVSQSTLINMLKCVGILANKDVLNWPSS